jgi:hypothetical protein
MGRQDEVLQLHLTRGDPVAYLVANLTSLRDLIVDIPISVFAAIASLRPSFGG